MLQGHLDKAEARLSLGDSRSADHRETDRALRERYADLEAEVSKEEASETTHGHHVSALEHSVREWLDRIAHDVP